MARHGDSNKEMVNAEGTDKYAAGAYTVAGETLYGPIYAMTPSGACVITVLKDSEGEDILTNYVANAIPLAAGELYFFRLPVHAITITVAPAQVYYIKQEKLA